MKLLLLGGAGHVGSFIIPYLKRQHTLRVLDVRPPRHSDVEYVEGSVTDPESLKRALDGFVDDANSSVTGDIRMTLHAGRAVVTGRRSEESLYDYSLATYDTGDMFDQSLAKGFVELWSLPSKIAAQRDARVGRD